MTAVPRIVFVRFITSESPKLVPWVTHAERVVAGTRVTTAGGDDGCVVWQLVSANNRQLARGIGVHASFEDARAHAANVVTSALRLVVEPVSEAGHGAYGWFASLDGEPVATCARWYSTDRDRRNSIHLAFRSFEIATLHEGARLTDPALMAEPRAVNV